MVGWEAQFLSGFFLSGTSLSMWASVGQLVAWEMDPITVIKWGSKTGQERIIFALSDALEQLISSTTLRRKRFFQGVNGEEWESGGATLETVHSGVTVSRSNGSYCPCADHSENFPISLLRFTITNPVKYVNILQFQG